MDTMVIPILFIYLFISSPEDIVPDCFSERGKEKHQCEREALIGCLPYAPKPGMMPET